MVKLFLDTTAKLQIGLLDKNDEWLFFDSFEGEKTSHIVHQKIKEVLEEKTDQKISALEEVIYMSGPGSYTGTRLGAGIVDLLAWQGLKTYSFYHFDIPYLCGTKAGTWFCKAFKNEMFVYDWKGEESSYYLVDESKISSELEEKKGQVFSYEDIEVSIDYKNSYDLLTSNLSDLCQMIREKEMKKEIFYFRTAENEFKRSTKP